MSTNQLIVKKLNLNHKFGITIENVFSKEECKEWIELTEKQGYEAALVNIGYGKQALMTDVRNNDRCIIDSDEMANKIYERVKEFIPKTFRGYDGKDKDVVSLNERLRFLRYYPGQEFKVHQDGNYQRESGPKKGECSYITLQLYLNEVEKGGETSFFLNNEKIDVNPKTGMVLLFQHNIYHSGSPVINGTKYVVRTDVMYSK